MSEAPSPLWTLEEAASYLRMHRTTLGQLAGAGTVASIQHTDGGRRWFTRDLLDAYIVERARKRAAEQRAAEHARATAKPNPVSPWQEAG